MELPLNAKHLISEYSKPITRPDWRKGSACVYAFKNSKALLQMYYMYFKYYLCSNEIIQNKYKLIEQNKNLPDILKLYGESIYLISPYNTYIVYNNFYFILKFFSYLKYTITNVYIINEIVDHNYF
jgi:hypothetical protein